MKIQKLISINNRKTRLIIFLITIIFIGASFRLYLLDKKSIWYDEAVYIRVAKSDVLDILTAKVFHYGNPPLSLILLHFWMKLFVLSNSWLWSEPRYLICVLPLFYIIIVDSVLKLKFKVLKIALAVFIIFFSLFSTHQFFNRSFNEDWRSLSNYLEENREGNELIILLNAYSAEPFSYYYQNESTVKEIFDMDSLKEEVKNEDKFWYVFALGYSENYLEYINEINKNFILTFRRDFSTAKLYKFVRKV